MKEVVTMGRVKLDLPQEFIYFTEISVRIGDINYGGHMGNDSVLSIIHESRLRFLKNYGFSELDAGGAGIIMADSVIVYKNQSFHGDLLKVEVTVQDFNRCGCDIFYKLSLKESGKEIVRAKTGIVFFDYEINKVSAVPEKFKAVFGE